MNAKMVRPQMAADDVRKLVELRRSNATNHRKRRNRRADKAVALRYERDVG